MSRESRRFPMQGGPEIDWDTAEQIYTEYACLYGHDQSLETLAQRGGFGWAEVEEIHKRYLKKSRAKSWIS